MTSSNAIINRFLNAIRPFKTHYDLVRFGPNHDGGYVLANIGLSGLDFILTAGIGPSLDFEHDICAFSATNASVFAIDPDESICTNLQKRYSVLKNKFILKPYALGYVSTRHRHPASNILNLSDLNALIAKEFNLPSQPRSILKVDVEGAEWDIFAKTRPSEFENFEQILFEGHFYNKIEHLKAADVPLETKVLALENINKTHKLVHIHGNNWVHFIQLSKDTIFPQCFELTFVRKDLELSEAYSTLEYPLPIDIPNKPGYPDLFLGQWPFQ